MTNYQAEDFNVLIKGDSLLLQEKYLAVLDAGTMLISGLQYPILSTSVQELIDVTINRHAKKIMPVRDIVTHYRKHGAVLKMSNDSAERLYSDDEVVTECLRDIANYVLKGGRYAEYEYKYILGDGKSIHLVPEGGLCKEWRDIVIE